MTYISSMIDFADKFSDLVRDQSEWSQATFGADEVRGPMFALRHLELEARECQGAIGKPELITELADCLLLLDASRRANVKPMQLVEAAIAKMVVNKTRTWPIPTDDRPVEHVRDLHQDSND